MQRGRRFVAGQRDVAGQEVVAEVFTPQEFQVHGQEGGVVDPVEMTQLVVEFEAVQQCRAAFDEEDVVGEQVAVAVNDVVLVDPAREQMPPAGDVLRGKTFDTVDDFPRHTGNRGELVQFLEVGPPTLVHRAGLALGADQRAALGPLWNSASTAATASSRLSADSPGPVPVTRNASRS